MCEQKWKDPLAYVGESPIRRLARRVHGPDWEPVPISDDDDDALDDALVRAWWAGAIEAWDSGRYEGDVDKWVDEWFPRRPWLR